MPPSPEYLDLVTRYAQGEQAIPIDRLGGLSADHLKCDLDNLQAAAVGFNRCPDCDDKVVFEQFSLRAAMLLHGHREAMEHFGQPVSEQASDCDSGRDAELVERLASLLLMVDADAERFLSRFYAGMARRAHWSHCLVQAEQWARAGLAQLPKDGTLLLTLGIALETNAFRTVRPAPRTATLGPRAMRQWEAQNAKLVSLWDKARRVFEDAVKAHPNLLEARLRLGRVLWRLDDTKQARAYFEHVLASRPDPTLQFLAHLFLGRLHEDEGELLAAEAQYDAAVTLRPLSERAAVALSQVRLLLGDADSARELLESAMTRSKLRTEVDPYDRYPMAHAADGHRILATLRQEVAR